MENLVLQTIFNRFSCRNYTDKIPTDSDILKIASAGAAAPSAMNRQAWRIIAVRNRYLIAEMEAEGMRILSEMPDKSSFNRIKARGGNLYYNAQRMFIIAVKNSDTNGYELMDAGIVVENIALAAHSLGINSVICGLAGICFSGDKKQYFAEKLNFPDGYEFGIGVLIGYSATNGTPHEIDRNKIIEIN